MRRHFLLAAVFALLPLRAMAHEFLLDGLQIIHPSLPATPVGAQTAPVYMVIANDGAEDERLLGIETPFGPVTFLRPVAGADGKVTMQALAWIDIPAGEIVTLTRGRMETRGRVSNVPRPLFEGDELTGTMVFQKRGRFDMFFLIDPLEAEEDPTLGPAPNDAGPAPEDILAIAQALRAEPGLAEAIIAPVVVAGDAAIAGWTLGDDGARAFLRRKGTGWQVELWSGASLLLPASLTSLGVPAPGADRLRAEMVAREAALGPGFAARFDAFPGTVFVPGEPPP